MCDRTSDPTMHDALVAVAATSPEYEGSMGFLECPYCNGHDDGQEWSHADDCPWLALHVSLEGNRTGSD